MLSDGTKISYYCYNYAIFSQLFLSCYCGNKLNGIELSVRTEIYYLFQPSLF